ncbi:MAG: tRNA dihydrouridine synthase DusB [Chitinivibrionales bacterium]|nr:tRNA dihydrouridine synthase DusB [Chitinivibrionales bacterium]
MQRHNEMFVGKLFLAPLAGITNSLFRSICKHWGADVVVSEMISAEGVHYKARNTTALLSFESEEIPIGIQLFGSCPDRIAEAALVIQETVRPQFIDLNCGCPVPKVVKKNGGAALLRSPILFEKIVKKLVAVVSLPVTVKMRSGWHTNQWVDVEFAKIAQDCGVSAITLHPRSKTMGYSGHSFWQRIRIVKESVSIPVIGNGDITSPQDAAAMVEQTGCDSLMIGRAALGNPWIFTMIKQNLTDRSTHRIISPQLKYETILDHIDRYSSQYGEKKACQEMKKQCAWYVKGSPGCASLRNQIFHSNSVDELKAAITSLFQSLNNILNQLP